MAEQGEHIVWASCFDRLQMLPQGQVAAGGSLSFLIGDRSTGPLTGWRSPVAAGRIPIETTACTTSDELRIHGANTHDATIVFAAWVDNYCTFGCNLPDSIFIAEWFELGIGAKLGSEHQAEQPVRFASTIFWTI